MPLDGTDYASDPIAAFITAHIADDREAQHRIIAEHYALRGRDLAPMDLIGGLVAVCGNLTGMIAAAWSEAVGQPVTTAEAWETIQQARRDLGLN